MRLQVAQRAGGVVDKDQVAAGEKADRLAVFLPLVVHGVDVEFRRVLIGHDLGHDAADRLAAGRRDASGGLRGSSIARQSMAESDTVSTAR